MFAAKGEDAASLVGLAGAALGGVAHVVEPDAQVLFLDAVVAKDAMPFHVEASEGDLDVFGDEPAAENRLDLRGAFLLDALDGEFPGADEGLEVRELLPRFAGRDRVFSILPVHTGDDDGARDRGEKQPLHDDSIETGWFQFSRDKIISASPVGSCRTGETTILTK